MRWAGNVRQSEDCQQKRSNEGVSRADQNRIEESGVGSAPETNGARGGVELGDGVHDTRRFGQAEGISGVGGR